MRKRYSRKTYLALCCECGEQRSVTDWENIGEVSPEDVTGSGPGYARCCVVRKCYVCHKETNHAYLREGDDRDEIESAMADIDTLRAAEHVIAKSELPDVLEWLHDHGVRVEWTPASCDEAPRGKIVHYLDDGLFLVVLDPESDALTVAQLLKQAVFIIEDPQTWPIWFVQPAGNGKPPLAFCPLTGPGQRKTC